MNTIIKKAVRAGNSSAVILPKSWLDKEVKIELVKKTPNEIMSDIVHILKDHIDLGAVTGIYLTGSYARGEEDENSDIDVLVITNNIDREIIKEGVYNVVIISSDLLEYKLKKDLLPIGPMIKEAKPLLNAGCLDSIDVKITKDNVKWYLDTTKNKLKIIKEIINKSRKSEKSMKERFSDKIAYTLVLRIRTLHLIKKMAKNKSYSKKEFVGLMKKISGGTNAYERYLTVKNNLPEKNGISLEEITRLHKYLKEQLTDVMKLVK